ncbi:hypothetical protein A3Q56_06160 [Intoshia linei]|uniref:Uncharacterized protein n=1 Tax=Intoshia linei TaxID=1819745 RepID=A0A177AXA5_9BILA|nr:hypothetical protein A3Q56_06160 [Intoshia linei]
MCPIKLGDKFRLILSTTMGDHDFANDGEYDPSQPQGMRSIYYARKGFSN